MNTNTVEMLPGFAETTLLELPSRKTRRTIVVFTLLMCWIVITAILLNGDSLNSLHSSALAWAFSLNAATLFAYVFGSVVDIYNLSK